jgi:hypothetical protein
MVLVVKTANYDGDGFPNSATDDTLFVVDSLDSKLVLGFGSTPCLSAQATSLHAHGIFSASSYSNLPVASESSAGVVLLSSSTNSTNSTTAATSLALATLSRELRMGLDTTTTATATKLKSGQEASSYLILQGDTSNVGVNCAPEVGYTLDVGGGLRAAGYSNLPVASTFNAGIVMLSSATDSTSSETAATSSAVAQLAPAVSAIVVSTPNQTILKNGATAYINLRGDTSNVGINCLPMSSYTMDVNGNTQIRGNLVTSGEIVASGNITGFSDRRLKTDLQRISNPLEKLRELTGYTFKRVVGIDDGKDKDKRYVGLIAQEVLAVLPEAVEGSHEHGYSVAYGNLAALLVEAIREVDVKLNHFEERVANLERTKL